MADSHYLTGGLATDLDLHEIDLIPPSPTQALSEFDAALSDIYSPPPGATFAGSTSYHGSPYSGASDLSEDLSAPLFDVFPDYNPTDFDHPSPQYMLFGNPGYSDYSSPSSNGGSPHPSPRLDVQQSFENMSFNHRSPSWGTEGLPESRPSPPRLMMPDNERPPPPTINAPEGDGAPGLNIVPATPTVTGGINHAYNHSQGRQPAQSNWSARPRDSSSGPSLGPSSLSQEPYQFPARQQSNNDSLFIPPSGSRTRSKSESSPVQPAWDQLGLGGGDLGMSSIMFDGSSAVSDSQQPFSFPDFLSPDTSQMPNGLRRSRSDVGNPRPTHIRGSRSEDIGVASYLMPPGQGQETFGTYLQVMNMEGGVGRGRHVRRASSGSRSERGISSHDVSPAPSSRASPYPSPNVSPRGPIHDLPNVPQVTVGGQPMPMAVTKMNVTTGRTKVASHSRRKQEAAFVCPIPGCGSTFTRSFNLKGHIRSHNEEKPFVCPWPGCNKGFARQHDCKRHEQLHSNYRPFSCDGCQKQFARMDALNRHLKSEGGADCAKLLVSKGITLPLTPPKLETMPTTDVWEGLQL